MSDAADTFTHMDGGSRQPQIGELRGSLLACCVLVALLVLTGCTTGTAGPPDDRTPTERPSSTSEVDDPSLPTVAFPEPVWVQSQRWRRGDQDSFGVATDRHVLLWPSPTGPPNASVQTTGGQTLLVHTVNGRGWTTQEGYLGDDVAVFVDVNTDALEVAVTAYRISTGEVLDTSPTRRDVLGPEADLADTRLAYAQGTPQTGMCIHILNLDDGTEREVACEAPAVQLGDLALVEDVLTYTRLTASTTPQRCKSIVVVNVGSEFGTHNEAAEDAARDSDTCGNWSAVSISEDAVVWDNARPAAGLSTAPLFGFVDGETLALGGGYTDSARSCGGWAVWLRAGANQFSEIVGWTPGLSRPVQIRAAEEDVELTTPYCADDRWLTTRADDISGSDERLTLWRLDTVTLARTTAE